MSAIDADALLDDRDDGFRLERLDFGRLLADGVPKPDYVERPYLPRGARVWAFGPAEGGKTIHFQAAAARVTRRGGTAVFVSEENPLATDLDRMSRLRPDFERLRYYHASGLDLADREHFEELALTSAGADVLVLDTLSACWSGDEASNAEVAALDREVFAPLVRLTGATVVVIHHTGHPQAFVNRGGVGAGRGASAMGQKADVVLVFKAAGPHEFTIEQAKNRTPGGVKAPKARFRVVDTEDGGLDVVPEGTALDPRVAECADAAVEILGTSADRPSTNGLKEALRARSFGGSTIDPALDALRAEDPPRVVQVDGTVVGADGKRRRGRPWALADSAAPTEPDRARTEPRVPSHQPSPPSPNPSRGVGPGPGSAPRGSEDPTPGLGSDDEVGRMKTMLDERAVEP